MDAIFEFAVTLGELLTTTKLGAVVLGMVLVSFIAKGGAVMIITIVCSLIVAVFAVVGAVLLVERSRRTANGLRANITSLQNKLALEVQANTRLEIENARMYVEVKELRLLAVKEIDMELVAKTKAVAA